MNIEIDYGTPGKETRHFGGYPVEAYRIEAGRHRQSVTIHIEALDDGTVTHAALEIPACVADQLARNLLAVCGPIPPGKDQAALDFTYDERAPQAR